MPPSSSVHIRQESGDITVPEVKSQPPAGVIADVLITLIAVTLLVVFIIVLGIFIDSWLFVFITGVIKYGVDLNSSYDVCSAALFLCLTFYMTAKIIKIEALDIQHFCSDHRITRIDNNVCIIGMQRGAMVALLAFDTFVNFYLTTLFLVPLRCLYASPDLPQTSTNVRLRSMVMRTFVGAILTTISSSSIVVHWVTSHDNAATESSTDLKISILTAARHSYRDRPPSGGESLMSSRITAGGGSGGTGTGNTTTGGIIRPPAAAERHRGSDYHFSIGGGGGRGEGGIGIHRSVTTTTEYIRSLDDDDFDELDVTAYPHRRADAAGAYWSTELLNYDRADETTPLQRHDGGGGSSSEPPAAPGITVAAATASKKPPIITPGLPVSTGVVETVIISGKDTPKPFEN
ncbi:hypothetical protein G7054_g5810 [Neopestalotiopsis clavispora]|nr:hypothetical protein G7054_g5810 [Neopestalotiopsis clavispora]